MGDVSLLCSYAHVFLMKTAADKKLFTVATRVIRYPFVRSAAAVARLQFEFYPVGGSTTVGATHSLDHISREDQSFRIILHVPSEIGALPASSV
jgi:hypothetical protein